MLSARDGGIMKGERSLVPAPFPFILQHVVIEFPERTSDCPEPKTFEKTSHKKRIAIPMTRGRDKRLGQKGFGALMVNRCALPWCGRDLWVETAHSHLPCFALCRKTTPNKQWPSKLYKIAVNSAQVTQKKQQQVQVYVSLRILTKFRLFNNHIEFLIQSLYSFVICKTVSKFAVIYAPSLGLFYTRQGFFAIEDSVNNCNANEVCHTSLFRLLEASTKLR